MKNILLATIALAFAACFFQAKAQQVIATSGGYYEGESLSLSWTLGEPVIETFNNGELILTQGFQQPYNFYLRQILNIPMGWSGVSSYLDPVNKGMDGIFAPVQNNLIIMASMDGVYFPGQGINTLGNWNFNTGYQIKAEDNFGLTITGSKIPNPELELAEGWNLVPVLSACEVDVENLFSGIPSLQIVKEVAGTNLFWPAYNINTLGNLVPGKAYFVASADGGTVTFPECAKSSPKTALQQKPENITPWNDLSYSANSHVVAFPAAAFENSGIKPGDVIGAFTMDNICAGRLEIQNNKSNTAFSIFGDDVLTTEIDGFENAEPFLFKIYRSETDEVFDLEIGFNPTMPNIGYFAEHGISAVSGLKLQVTGLKEITSISLEVYPNPSQGIFNLRINKSLENPSIQITDFRGSLLNISQPAISENGMQLMVDLIGLPRGVYFLSIRDNGFVGMNKIVLH